MKKKPCDVCKQRLKVNHFLKTLFFENEFRGHFLVQTAQYACTYIVVVLIKFRIAIYINWPSPTNYSQSENVGFFSF